MRVLLERVYTLSGILAGIFIVLIGLFVLVQIILRFFGLILPGALELAGFSLLASSFLALPYTLKHGEHIRVSLVIENVSSRRRRYLEIWCLLVGTFMAGYLVVHVIQMAWEAWVFQDQSLGVLAIPLWIPQVGMALGVMLLFVALVEELVGVLRGEEPSYNRAETSLIHREENAP